MLLLVYLPLIIIIRLTKKIKIWYLEHMNNKGFHDIDCKYIFSYMKGYTEFVCAFIW